MADAPQEPVEAEKVNNNEDEEMLDAPQTNGAIPSQNAGVMAEDDFSEEDEDEPEDDGDSDGGGGSKKKGGKSRRVVSPRVNALQIWSHKQKKYIYEV